MTGSNYNNGYILWISFVSALGGYLFGFDFAVISGALPFLREQFALTSAGEGFLTGTLALGCIGGCLIAGILAEKYGRKPGLLVSALIFTLSSLGMAFSHSLSIFLMMRFAAGIGVGMASVLSPMYIAEISPASVRGRNVSINQLTIVIGILATNLINYFIAGKTAESWRWMFGLGAIPSSLFFIAVMWLPESPRWLIKVNQPAKASQILSKIGNPVYANASLSEMIAMKDENSKKISISVLSKVVRPALVIGITLAVFQQLCGINIVFNYTSTIFASVGADLNRQLLETVAIGIVNLFFTLLAMRLVDRLGRRPLMLWGSLGLAVLYIALAIALQWHLSSGWVSLFVLSAIGLYATSLAPVTWVLISEIFPNQIRGAASAFAIVSLWLAYFILVFTFPILAEKMGTYGPFYFYAIICFLGFIFVRIKVKETKGQTLEALEHQLKENSAVYH